MNVGRAFSFAFEDKTWVAKILVGGLLILFSWLIIPFFFILGYMVEATRNIALDIEPSLPEWDKWGEKLTDGFQLAVVYFIYELPVFIVYIVIAILVAILGSLANANSAAVSVFGILTSIFLFIGVLGVAVYALFIFFLLPSIVVRYSMTKSIGAALDYKACWKASKEHVGDVLIVLLLLYAASFIASLGTFIFFIGFAFTTFYSLIVSAGLYGELYKAIGEKIGNEKPLIGKEKPGTKT